MKKKSKIAITLCATAAALTALGFSVWGYMTSSDRQKEALIHYMNSEGYKTTRALTEAELQTLEEEIAILGTQIGNGEADVQDLIKANKEYEEKKAYFNSTQYTLDHFRESEEYSAYSKHDNLKLISGMCWTTAAMFAAIANSKLGDAIFSKKDEENS